MVTVRLLHNKFLNEFSDTFTDTFNDTFNTCSIISPSMPTLVRQDTYSKPSLNKQKITRGYTIPPNYKHNAHQNNIFKKNVSNLLNTNQSSVQTFGLYRQQSTAMYNNGSVINGSIKCYTKQPNIDFSKMSNNLSNLANSNKSDDELKFQNILKKNNVKQYELYMGGGLFGRFKQSYTNDSLIVTNNTSCINELIDKSPLLTRSISTSVAINSRLLNTL
jgi:hypothetical protein